MTSHREDWPNTKRIFSEAIALAPSERAAFLDQACASNQELRRQVDDLLAAHDAAGTFLESSPRLQESEATRELIGTTIGPYKVLGRIGAGGMGEVYKAHDQRLNRTVAIKVLPQHLGRDRQASERFELEARAVAALNHPHICTLYDVGRQDGLAFLVMEYLEGETLATRLERGPLKSDQALKYAIQIASALDKVHRAGLVHRDLKPGNIMLTKAGAKVLDFGISKARPSMAIGDASTMMMTADSLTAAGSLLGTIRYMAPEQLGGQADARSDIFAFGAVFYEMLVGKRAFDGPSNAGVMSAILEQEPEASPRLTPLFDRVVRTCLAKDPDDRWQTARDLLRELQWMETRGESAGPSDSRANSARSGVRRTWPALLAVAVAALAGVIAYLAFDRTPTTPTFATRFEIATPPTSDPMSFSLSADGRQLVFVATQDGASKLWVRPLDQVAAQVLNGTDGASFPFWSPDGRAVAFFANGKLKRIDLNGGSAQVIADAPTGRGGSWSSEGVILFAPATAGVLMRVPADGGTPASATRLLAGENSHRWPQFLPDGRRFLYLSTQGQPGSDGVFLGALNGDTVTRVLADDSYALFTSPGRLVLAREGTLMSLAFDPDTGVVSGDPTVVAKPVGFDTQLSRGAFAVSATGVVAHRTAMAALRQLTWVDASGRVLGTVGPADEDGIAAPELTRDGHQVAVFRSVEGNDDIWTIPVNGGVPNRFTFGPGAENFSVWSPSGERLAYASTRDTGRSIHEQSLQGVERALFAESGLKLPMDYSPDGRHLLYAVQVPGTGVDLWALPMGTSGGGAAFAVSQMPFNEMAGQFSTDGRWIAYQTNATGRLEVYVRPFATRGSPQQVSLGGGSQPRWSPDGKALFYVSADRRMMSVQFRVDVASGAIEFSPPQALFETHLATGANIPPAVGSRAQYAVAPDGRFLMNVAVQNAPAPPITVFVAGQTGATR